MASHSPIRVRITHESYVNFLASIRTLPAKRTARHEPAMGSCVSGSDLSGCQYAPCLPANPEEDLRHDRTKLKQWKLR
jgi:hypothetical protein